jgi:hypothetical protein
MFVRALLMAFEVAVVAKVNLFILAFNFCDASS